MHRPLAALTAALALAPIAFAQTPENSERRVKKDQDSADVYVPPPPPPKWVYASIGASFSGAEGFEFALGLQADWNRTLYVRASPLNLVLTDAQGFYIDQFSNGQSRCRDESNGQFATDSSCTGLDYRVDADAYLRVGGGLLVGGGVMHTVSSDYTPEREGQTDSFFAVMFESGDNWGVELRGGKDNGAIRLRASF